MTTKQRTFHVDGQKIVIKSRPKTYVGNLIGYGVDINGTHYNIFNEIYREKAEDKAYTKWVAEFAPARQLFDSDLDRSIDDG